VFNARTGKLTAQASNAIKRIFNIADHNFNDVIEKVGSASGFFSISIYGFCGNKKKTLKILIFGNS